MPTSRSILPVLLMCSGLSGCLGGSVSLEAPVLPAGEPLPLTAVGPLESLAGERLTYQVTFAGVPAGSLETWGSTVDGLPGLHLDGRTTGLLDLLHPVRAIASTRLGADRRPEAFQIWCEEDGAPRARRVRFGSPTTLWWQEGARISPRAVPIESGAALDPLSFLWMLRSAPPVGTFDVEVLAGPRADRYRVHYLGRAAVAVAAGDFADSLAYRIEIRSASDRVPDPGPRMSFELYLDGAPPHVPVLLRRSLAVGSLAVELSAAGTAAAAPPAARPE